MAITSMLGDVATIIKGKRPGQVNIDSKVFQLHYRVTTFLFLGFSILSTANSLIGNPINCACGACVRAGISKEVINTHCWVSGTFTLPGKRPTDSLGLDKAFHGLGTRMKGEERKYHLYYQWVPFVLFLQGILFYIPHWMWEINEDGRVHALVHHLRLPTMDKETLKKNVGNLTMYVTETLGSYDGYYLRFVLCDAMNIVNVVCNLVFTDRFLNGEFLSYGPRCMHYFSNASREAVSPMTVTFPKLTKCTFQPFGASGSVQKMDAICVLALNIFNEKVYLILWFWLVALTVITVSVFVFRSLFMLMKRFRPSAFQRRALTIHTADIDDVVSNITVGDYFFLSLLAKNLDITAFRMFLAQLARVTRRRRPRKHDRSRRASRTAEAVAMLAPPEPAAPPSPARPLATAARPPSPARLRI